MKSLITFLLSLMVWGNIHSQISIIGPATPSGNWDLDHDLTETSPGIWSGTFNLNSGQLKFRLDHSWDFNWGGTAWPSGPAMQGGANINVNTAGNYNIVFNLTAETYSFTFLSSNVGIGTTSPSQKLHVNGKIKLSDDINAPSAGTIRWNSTLLDFEGYDGNQWLSLTKSNTPYWGAILLHENKKLTANDGADGDGLGNSVAISGNYAIVGVSGDDTGTNINQGSAYIFECTSTGNWVQVQKLTANDGSAYDFFGYSVSISGNYAIVGAREDDIGSNVNQGSAYIFVRDGAIWSQQVKLTASDGAEDDFFGDFVSIDGENAIVGVFSDDIGSNSSQGSTYIFRRDGTSWLPAQKLTASDGASYDHFGASAVISGDYVIVGAPGDDIGTNINQGSAYVFLKSGNTWIQQTKLTSINGAGYDSFGNSVAINGDYVIVGANQDGVGSSEQQGSAYIFKREGTTWSQQAHITTSDGSAFDNFGFSVAINGDYAIASARNDKINNNVNQGSAYIFLRSGNSWVQQAKLTSSESNPNDMLGNSVSINGNFVIVGAQLHDIGSNINQGAAYIFKKN